MAKKCEPIDLIDALVGMRRKAKDAASEAILAGHSSRAANVPKRITLPAG
jgi:hypothetical protein